MEKLNVGYEEMCSLIKDKEVLNYFDFPSTVIAFGESLKNSYLFEYKNIYFRKVHSSKLLTLITYFCTWEELKIRFIELQNLGYKVNKGLNFIYKDFPSILKEYKYCVKNYEYEFFAYRGYNLENILKGHSSKTKNTLKRKIKRSEEAYFISEKIPFLEDVLEVFKQWVEKSKKRHFMVIKGHYMAYIKRFYKQCNNVNFIFFNKKIDNSLYGFCGYEVYKNKVQITCMKHIIEDYKFPLYFWYKSILIILERHKEVDEVQCGYTADVLKKQLGLKFKRGFKLILNNIGVEYENI